jgi:hypothetical protein
MPIVSFPAQSGAGIETNIPDHLPNAEKRRQVGNALKGAKNNPQAAPNGTPTVTDNGKTWQPQPGEDIDDFVGKIYP